MKGIDVSVILSAYNEEECWFREAVESILNQSYENFELILILDNPNNTLLEGIINEYANKDNRIVYIKNEKNLGLVKSLNKGLEYARGKYIARMDADDISLSDRFEKQIRCFKEDNSLSIVGGNIKEFIEYCVAKYGARLGSLTIDSNSIIYFYDKDKCMELINELNRRIEYLKLNTNSFYKKELL